MRTQELTVDIKAKLDVDRQTAETCLGLAAIYANAHGCRIFGERADDGDIHYWIDGGRHDH